MEKIDSFEKLQSLFNEVRNLRKGFITNFYPDPFRISLWCRYHSLFFIRYADTIFFLRKRELFVNLFYCSVNEERLKDDLAILLKEYGEVMMIADLVGNESIFSHEQLFFSMGFKEHTSLVRMSRIGCPELVERDVATTKITEATSSDIPALMKLYIAYFDPYSEQIPLREELEQWIEAGHVLVRREKDRLVGFLIYDLIGVTLYLRYWFVHQDYRELKIGSALFHEFLFRGKDSKRQLFWVISSNDNAIKRYMHYGFLKEKMFDCVLIKS